MFSYYGTKYRLGPMYPAPIYDTIVEPFAGAAGYALAGDNWQRRVQLYDINPKIVMIWRFLIGATVSEIMSLPDVEPGMDIRDFGLFEPARMFMAFCIAKGVASPQNRVSPWNRWSVYRKRAAENAHKIRHWTVDCRGYSAVPDLTATWFVDPPYQKGPSHGGGTRYMGFKNLDFGHLGNWCRGRNGQTIVCEADGATWLNFRPLTTHRGCVGSRTEMIWESYPPGFQELA